MVVIVDLEDEDVESAFQAPLPRRVSVAKPNVAGLILSDDVHEPNTRSIFQNSITRAFGQYPVWKWRSHYGEVLGGLGTGIGDGDRGVICGRESDCAAAKEVEQETDCDAEDARESSLETITPPGTPGSSLQRQNSDSSVISFERQRTPSPLQLGPGYERHEIEGIGGVVKKKLVRMVRVGACVPEWEDEKSKHKIMHRERSHQARSFCGWCYRVIPSNSEKLAAKSGQVVGSTSGSVA
ncbi:hypothetical protein ACHAQH_000566 [Verticillium albo-atrum]